MASSQTRAPCHAATEAGTGLWPQGQSATQRLLPLLLSEGRIRPPACPHAHPHSFLCSHGTPALLGAPAPGHNRVTSSPPHGLTAGSRCGQETGLTIQHQTLRAGVRASAKPAPSPRWGGWDTPGSLGVSGVPNLFSPKGARLGAREGKGNPPASQPETPAPRKCLPEAFKDRNPAPLGLGSRHLPWRTDTHSFPSSPLP